MRENTVEQKMKPLEVDTVDSEDALIARISADRRAGRDTTRDAAALLRRAGESNRAALDRLAQ